MTDRESLALAKVIELVELLKELDLQSQYRVVEYGFRKLITSRDIQKSELSYAEKIRMPIK
jgi:hypothetical protein